MCTLSLRKIRKRNGCWWDYIRLKVYLLMGVNRITYWSQGVASRPHKCQPPLSSARQHPSYGDCLKVKREYYQNCSVLGCVTQCSQSAAHSCEQFLHVQQIGFVAMHRGGCLELYYCNMVGCKPYLKDELISFSALTLLVWSYDL